MAKTFIVGAGSWGCGLASVLAENNEEIILYDSNKETINEINNLHINSKLPGVKLHKTIKATDDLKIINDGYNIVLLAVPTKVIRLVLKQINEVLTHKVLFLNVAKGIEAGSNKRISEVVKEEIKGELFGGYVLLTGPSHAEEVVEKKLTLVTSVSEDINNAIIIQNMFNNNNYFRVYTSDDLIGCEFCGALKNVYAIASGICSGLEMGDNARAALVTRSIAEIRRFLHHYGANDITLLGLSGVGDMIVTCTSNLSRNFQAGYMIAKGNNLKEALSNISMVVEGANTCLAVYDIAKKNNIYMPIVNAIYNVIYECRDPKEQISKLMENKLNSENK